MIFSKRRRRQKIRYGIRKKIKGTGSVPRLSIFRSNTQTYAQVVDDVTGETLFSASTLALKSKGTKTDAAKELGKMIADKAKDKSITEIKFDRSGYLYHGRVKALAEGAREGGLKF
jgi:large subunit ribosomal protein L18